MPPAVPAWIQILQALLTPVIGVIAIYIAWQQWRANVLKLKLERYERRLRIYDKVMSFITVTSRDFDPSLDEILTFARDTLETQFLFGKEVHEYVVEVRQRGLRVRQRSRQLKHYQGSGIPTDVDYQAFLKEMHADEAWFTQQHDEATLLFSPYLDLTG